MQQINMGSLGSDVNKIANVELDNIFNMATYIKTSYYVFVISPPN
jgi:hypothetical protein